VKRRGRSADALARCTSSLLARFSERLANVLSPLRAFSSRLGLASLLAFLGCSSEKGDLPTCRAVTASISEPITNGTPREEFLGLGEESLAAIVAIQNQPWPTGSLCTGVLLHESWVLTASHCLAIASPLVVVQRSPKDKTSARVLRSVTHPTLDASLLEIEAVPQLSGDSGILPLAIGTDLSWLDWLGQRVEIAGYGLTESAEPDGLRFAVETVIEVTDSKFRVDGFGRSGACEGDSGGPLLGRDRDGRPLVLGILSGGEASCFGRDRFIRTDALADWIGATVHPGSSAALPCGQITGRGRCLFNSALRCEGGVLEATACDTDEV